MDQLGNKRTRNWASAFVVCLSLFVCGWAAADNSTPGPEEMPSEAFAGLAGNSPFVRNLDVSGNLILSGYWEIGGESYVTVIDGRSRQSLVLSTTPDQQGRRVLELEAGAAMEEATAKVSIDGRVMSLRYDSKVVASMRPKTPPAPPGRGTGKRGRAGKKAQADISKSFSKLNAEQKQAMREEILGAREKLATMNPEERSGYIRQVIDRAASK